MENQNMPEPDNLEADQVPEGSNNPDFYEYFSERLTDPGFTIRLYRITENGQAFLKKFYSEIPDEEFIGQTWGGGRYYAWGKYPGGGKKHYSKKFVLDPYWNKVRAERERKEAEEQGIFHAPAQPVVHAEKGLDLAGIRDLLALFMPFMQNQNNNGSNAPMEKIMDGYTKMIFSGMNQMTREMLDVHKKIRDQVPAKPEKEDQTGSLIKSLVETALQYLPFLSSAKNGQPLANPIRDMVKNHPAVQALAQTRNGLEQLYTTLAGKKEIGEELTNQIFEQCGLISDDSDEDGNDDPAQEAVA